MNRSLRLVDQALASVGGKVTIPCNRDGVRVKS
jgi:hypothetical protein